MRRNGISLVLVATVLFSTSVVFAAPTPGALPGTPIGNAYSTDVVAYVDGVPIDSYNIGGRTAVALEDLSGYGFSMSQGPDSTSYVRLLSELTCISSWSGPATTRPGALVGTVRSTDMRVFINDLEIPAYDIGGKTVIVMEDLGTANPLGLPLKDHAYSKYGFSCVWDGSKRSISLYRLKPGMEARSDTGYYPVESVQTLGGVSSGLWERQFRLDGKAVLPRVSEIGVRVSMVDLEYYAPWVDVATALGLKWSRSADDGALVIESSSLSPLEAAAPAPTVSVEDYAGPFARIPLLDLKVSDRPAASCQVKAGVYAGRMYVRLDDIAKALDLVYAPLDGFYTRSDTPPCWEYGFSTGLGQEWVISTSPSWFTGGPHGGYSITGYDATAPITINFARPMDASTFNPKSVAVYVATPTNDGFYEYELISEYYTYAHDQEKRVLTITPSGQLDLPDGTRVTVAVKPSIADADGKHPANGMRVSFSAQPGTSGHPTSMGKSGGVFRSPTSVTMIDPENGWAITGTALLRTSDGGATWTEVKPDSVLGQSLQAGYQIEQLGFNDEGNGWVLLRMLPNGGSVDRATYRLLRTLDGGGSWSDAGAVSAHSNAAQINLRALTTQDLYGGPMVLEDAPEGFADSLQDKVAALTVPDARKGERAVPIVESVSYLT